MPEPTCTDKPAGVDHSVYVWSIIALKSVRGRAQSHKYRSMSSSLSISMPPQLQLRTADNTRSQSNGDVYIERVPDVQKGLWTAQVGDGTKVDFSSIKCIDAAPEGEKTADIKAAESKLADLGSFIEEGAARERDIGQR